MEIVQILNKIGEEPMGYEERLDSAREGRERLLEQVLQGAAQRGNKRPPSPGRRERAAGASSSSRDMRGNKGSGGKGARTWVLMDQELVQEVSARMQAPASSGKGDSAPRVDRRGNTLRS